MEISRQKSLIGQSSGQASLDRGLEAWHQSEGPNLLEVRVKKGARADLGRPTMTPRELKEAFMGFLRDGA